MTPQLPLLEEDYLPIRTAQQFGFDLPYFVSEDSRLYFRLRSWLAGCIGEDKAGKTIRNLRQRGDFSKVTPSQTLMVTEDINGQSVDFEYVTDELLYRITEDLRATKDRPVVSAIKDYLAKSGAFTDKLRRETQPKIEPPKNRQEEKYLAAQIVYGHMDRPAALQMLQTRRDTKTTFKAMMEAVSRVVSSPNYPQIADTEYIALFGYTAKELRALLNTDSVRDSLTDTQLSALQFLEHTMRDLLNQAKRMTNDDLLASMRRIAAQIQKVLAEVTPALPAPKENQ